MMAASPEAGLTRQSKERQHPRGGDTFLYLDHGVSGEDLVRFLLCKHIVHQAEKVLGLSERHTSLLQYK